MNVVCCQCWKSHVCPAYSQLDGAALGPKTRCCESSGDFKIRWLRNRSYGWTRTSYVWSTGSGTDLIVSQYVIKSANYGLHYGKAATFAFAYFWKKLFSKLHVKCELVEHFNGLRSGITISHHFHKIIWVCSIIVLLLAGSALSTRALNSFRLADYISILKCLDPMQAWWLCDQCITPTIRCFKELPSSRFVWITFMVRYE